MQKITSYDIWDFANSVCGQIMDILPNVTFPEKKAARKGNYELIEQAAELLEQTAEALRSRVAELRHEAERTAEPCPTCLGTGYKRISPHMLVDCPECHKTGKAKPAAARLSRA